MDYYRSINGLSENEALFCLEQIMESKYFGSCEMYPHESKNKKISGSITGFYEKESTDINPKDLSDIDTETLNDISNLVREKISTFKQEQIPIRYLTLDLRPGIKKQKQMFKDKRLHDDTTYIHFTIGIAKIESETKENNQDEYLFKISCYDIINYETLEKEGISVEETKKAVSNFIDEIDKEFEKIYPASKTTFKN